MNVFELFATLVLNKKAYEQGMKDAEGEAQGFGGRLKGILGGAAQVTGAAIAAGFTAASAAAGKIVGQATNAYASYEQLVGGVVTLFGNAADTVQKNADNAFKTVGMSANQYMETVTSFAASLTQSLGGDTARAAEYADTALRDMADNANKMGTNIQSIQNAYQGFAKQNYTMLDNLNTMGALAA